MDVEPIYCAEQIVVPDDFADILKAFTKEVIRHQPEDLLQFSALYFGNLANISQGLAAVQPPSREQLQIVYTSLPSRGPLYLSEIRTLCKHAGIEDTALNKVQELGGFQPDEKLIPKQFLVLLLTMTGRSLPSVMSGLFEVFGEGGKLETEEFIRLLEYVAALDSQLTPQMMTDLADSLQDSSFATFASLGGNPVLKGKLH